LKNHKKASGKKIKSAIICLIILFCVYLPAANAESNISTHEIKLIDVIKMTIEKDSNIRVNKSQQRAAGAGELSAKAVFDPNLKASVTRSSEYTPLTENQKKSYSNSGHPDVSKTRQSALSYSVGYEKRFRSGTSISPSLTVSTTESNTPSGTGPFTNSKIQFSLTKPLAKGNNIKVNTADEKTSAIESECSSLDTVHTISKAVRDVINSYWSYAYSYKSLKISNDARDRAQKLYDETKMLVDNFETPPAELDQLKASLFEKEAECEKARQALLEAKNSLKTSIGTTDEVFFTNAVPADFFPIENIINETCEVERLVKELTISSLKNRNDYIAAMKRLEKYNFSIPAARDSLRPQVDLQITAGYSGLKEDKGAAALISSINNNVPGANVSAVVSYSFNPDKKSARAELIKIDEQYIQSQIKAEELKRQIGINIETNVSSVSSIYGRYKRMIEAIKLYNKALQNEREKSKMGASTLIDVVSVEDKLGSAELSLEAAVLEYATAVTKLRFEAGCLGKITTSECEINSKDLLELPKIGTL